MDRYLRGVGNSIKVASDFYKLAIKDPDLDPAEINWQRII